MDVTKVLITNYLPYSKGVIISRALPAIDGLKPSQRRVLNAMYELGLLKGDKIKSTKIVGSTMQWHPHGDATIYDTLVRMSSGHDALNVPYIESKGNFGKVYSKDLAYAASRYTEAKLSQICEEMFDGIKENAVDYIPNYDDTLTEPTLLPVKFPNILVNPSSGIAVGTGSSIPSFGLNNVCSAVIALCEGKINDTVDLVNILGIPEFTTGGYVHTTRDEIVKLVKTGHGTIQLTGRAITYSDRIEIVEIPYRTTVEAIIESVEDGIKNGTLKEIASINDEIGLKNGLKITLQLKRGANPAAVLKKLIYLTPFGSTMSFNTRVIINDRCETLGIDELLNRWIEFRMKCIARIYQYRYEKNISKIYLLESWEKIKLDIRTVANLIANKSEYDAKIALMQGYNLEDKQAEYLLDMRIREFTQDRLEKHLKELEKERQDAVYNKNVVDSDDEKRRIIVEDQKRIIDKYAKQPNKTHIAAPLAPDDSNKKEVVIDDSTVGIVISKNGYMKRLLSINDISGYELPDDEEEMVRLNMKNNEHILVFCYDGTVYKILANDVDAGRGKLRDKVDEILGIDMSNIMFIDAAGDYSKHFNVVYSNGRGFRVNYSRAQGNRKKYRSLFEPSKPGQLWWTFADQFFMITTRRKASYCDLKFLDMGTRLAFKVARVSSGDSILGLQDAANVPDINSIDMTKYRKDYTVLIGEDELWPGAREKYLERLRLKEEMKEKEKKAKIKK